MMNPVVLAVTCTVCLSHARRVQTSMERLQEPFESKAKAEVIEASRSLQALATFFQKQEARVAFNPSGPGAHWLLSAPTLTGLRQLPIARGVLRSPCSLPMCVAEPLAEKLENQTTPLSVPTSDQIGEQSPKTTSPRFMSKAWFSKWMKFDKEMLSRLGVDAFFTYGIVSNLNVALTSTLAWVSFSKASGLSPLAPGQWKGFVAAYGVLYLSLGSVLRPFRMALAVAMTPVYSKVVAKLREYLPLRESRPKVNRLLAVFAITIVFNVIGTFSLIAVGASIAGIITGVPPIPAGWKPFAA